MRMTKDEQKRRRAELRWKKHRKIIDGYRSALVEMYRRAAKEHWSHQRMMKYEREWISRTTGSCVAAGIGNVPRTAYESAYIQGVKDVLWNQHWSHLTYCNRHPDKPWMYRPVHELCQQGFAMRLCCNQPQDILGGHLTIHGNHFYRNDGADIANEYTDPFDASATYGREATRQIWDSIPEVSVA